ncbi:hypothetical protein [Clostridium botulinum]
MIFYRDYSSFYELCKEVELTCSQTVITSMSMIKDRIKVILVGECLGF